VIVIGIDPHKKTHTAVAAAESGRPLENITVPARHKGHEGLLEWARGLEVDRIFAIEDCRHVSGSLERFLIERGEKIVRVPPKMMAGARRSARVAGKSDPIDALAVAQAALRSPDLPEAHLDGPERELRMLLDHREDLVNERTRIEGRLRWHLHDIDPTISVPLRSLGAFKWLDKLEELLAKREQTVQVEITRELIGDCWRLSKRANRLQKRIQQLVADNHAPLLEIPGVAALTAAKLVGEIAGIERFATDGKLAVHAGVAPLQASSGNRQRHRLNRGGNRQLNAAFHRIAVTQIRCHGPAGDYVERKMSEGKTKREAIRCLKRQLVRVVFNTLRSQHMTSTRTSSKTLPDLHPAAA
jgi:transposase